MNKKIKKVKKGGFLSAIAGPLITKTSDQLDDLIGTIFGNAIKKGKNRKGGRTKRHRNKKTCGGTIVQSGPLP